ncbi:substrate-binding periplasmic protein [Undibacterium sp. TJN25]|uniref:substrate-binding periplasmic protein n=1 Tax=Undibacterium sp. TJN25 TaxID=3413056 RepID=UPI003BF370CD
MPDIFTAGASLKRVARCLLPVCIAMAAMAAGAGSAECSRPFVVPVSSTGSGTAITKKQFGSIYLDVLRSAGKKNGCEFVFSVVPRSRQEAMFQSGQSDILLPAIRTPRRDEAGLFVPLLSVRATLISVAAERPAIRSLQELLEHREMKLALVRGYDYGAAYLALVSELKSQGRLILESDPTSVARQMLSGAANATIMTSPIFSDVVQTDKRLEALQSRLRYEGLDDLPWIDSGAYLSKTALSAEDKEALQDLFESITKSGTLLNSLRHHGQADSLKDSVRPFMAARPAN